MSSSSSPITWKSERGCCTVEELSQFKLLLSKISSLDRFCTLLLGLLFWKVGLMKDLCCASLPVYSTGETRQGLTRHRSIPQCRARVPALLPCAAAASLCCGSPERERRHNLFSTDSTACTGSQSREEGEAAVIQMPAGWRTERKEKMLGWDRGEALGGEEQTL